MLKISSILSALTITIKLCVSPDYTRRHKEISPKGRSINENEISAKSGKKKKKNRCFIYLHVRQYHLLIATGRITLTRLLLGGRNRIRGLGGKSLN